MAKSYRQCLCWDIGKPANIYRASLLSQLRSSLFAAYRALNFLRIPLGCSSFRSKSWLLEARVVPGGPLLLAMVSEACGVRKTALHCLRSWNATFTCLYDLLFLIWSLHSLKSSIQNMNFQTVWRLGAAAKHIAKVTRACMGPPPGFAPTKSNQPTLIARRNAIVPNGQNQCKIIILK